MSENDEEGLSHDICGGKCSLGKQCNGTCINKNSSERRYLCEEEGECKNIAEACDSKCMDKRYFCKEKATCLKYDRGGFKTKNRPNFGICPNLR